MKRILASLALAALLLSGVVSAAMAQSPSGVITGQVVNGTAGGTLPASLQITVQGYTAAEVLTPQTVVADANGQFRFEGLDTSAGHSYVVYTEYLGIQYGSEELVFENGKTGLEAPVVIYETTTSDEAISLGRVHFVVSPADQALEVNEVLSFSNTGDRTYIGSDPAADAQRTTVRFAAPAGAQDLQLDEDLSGERFVETADGYLDTLPVVPGSGTLRIVLSYFLPYDPDSTMLTSKLLYPAKIVNVFVPQSGPALSSSQMMSMGAMGTGEQAYLGYVGQNFAAGDTIALEFKGAATGSTATPVKSGGLSGTGMALVIGGLALLLIGLAVAYPALRRKQSPALEAAEMPCGDECEQLMASIADLDDLYEAGELDAETYQRRRQALKARLLETQSTKQE